MRLKKPKETFWYQVYPTSYPMLTSEEQDSIVDGFKSLLNMIKKPISIYTLRYPVEYKYEDLKVKGYVSEFYIESCEPIDRAPVRLVPLASPPELPEPEAIYAKGFTWGGQSFTVLVITGFPTILTEGFFPKLLECMPIVRLRIIPYRDDIAYTIIRRKHRLVRPSYHPMKLRVD